MIIFILFGLLPLTILTGYILFIFGCGIGDITTSLFWEMIIGLVISLLWNYYDKESLKQILVISEKQSKIFLLIVLILCLSISAKLLYQNNKEKTTNNRIEENEKKITESTKRLNFMETELAKISGISDSNNIKDIYQKEIPVPQNWEEAFKQQVEADYEFRKNNFSVARKIYNNILDNYAKNGLLKSVLYNNIGATYNSENNFVEAIKWFNLAKNFKEYQINVHENLAVSYWKTGDINKAIKEYSEMKKKNPKDYTIENKIGIFYSLKGDNDNAIKQFLIAINNNAASKGTYFNLGLNYSMKGPEYDKEAIKYLELELEKYPNQPNVKFQLGAMYCWINNFEKGIKLIEEAIIEDNSLMHYFPKFFPQYQLSEKEFESKKISSIKIFPDHVEISSSMDSEYYKIFYYLAKSNRYVKIKSESMIIKK